VNPPQATPESGEAPEERDQPTGLADLLVEGIGLPAGFVERALRAFENSAKPLAKGGLALWSWLGVSSWVVAAALACEHVRKSRPRLSLAMGWRQRPVTAPEDEQ
jgi:hypothetical protein